MMYTPTPRKWCTTQTFRPTATLLSIALVVGVIAGLAVQARSVTPVYAACGTIIDCGLDDTVTSAIFVSHAKQINQNTLQEVEPDVGETWDIVATWSSDLVAPGGCSCKDLHTDQVEAVVSWSDSTGSWSVVCNGCNVAGPIYAVDICGVGGCGSGSTITNSWSYELIVDIEHTLLAEDCPSGGLDDAYLTSVDYETTSVDDGNLISVGLCSEGSSVSPTSQTWSVSDTGSFECQFTCAAASGPSIVIKYN